MEYEEGSVGQSVVTSRRLRKCLTWNLYSPEVCYICGYVINRYGFLT